MYIIGFWPPAAFDRWLTDEFVRATLPVHRRPAQEGWPHAETHLCHERERGRLHCRAGRRHRLERTERRVVPVLVRPGRGDGPCAVRAQIVGDDELPLADRRPTTWRHAGGGPVRSPLAGHAEGRV